MHMREEAPRQLQARVERAPAEAREALTPKGKSGGEQAHMRALAQGIVDDSFVLVDGDGAGGVDDDARGGGRGRGNAVERAEDELFLEVGEEDEVASALCNNRIRGCEQAGLEGGLLC